MTIGLHATAAITYIPAAAKAVIIYFLLLIKKPYPNAHITNTAVIVNALRLKSSTRLPLKNTNMPTTT